MLELDESIDIRQSLETTLKASFFQKTPFNWQPVKYELIINSKLTNEFKRKFKYLVL
jgi:hypothetical protein